MRQIAMRGIRRNCVTLHCTRVSPRHSLLFIPLAHQKNSLPSALSNERANFDPPLKSLEKSRFVLYLQR